MVCLKKFIITTTSAAALLALRIFATDPAQAAQFEFSFSSNDANGYFIFDNSIPPRSSTLSPVLGEYLGAVTSYYVNLGAQSVFQGPVANEILYLNRPGSNISRPTEDELILFVDSSQRQPASQYGVSNIFAYPEGSLLSTNQLPTSVPSSAELLVYPYVTITPNRSFGSSVFDGTVQTQIREVPEPSSLFAILGVAAWLMFCHHQRKQALPIAEMKKLQLLKFAQKT